MKAVTGKRALLLVPGWSGLTFQDVKPRQEGGERRDEIQARKKRARLERRKLGKRYRRKKHDAPLRG